MRKTKVTACPLRFTFSLASATLAAMLEFHPPRSPGRQVGLVLIGAILLVDLGLLFLLFSQPITILTFLWGILLSASLPALLTVVFLTTNLVAARYYVESETLVIEWGKLKQLIPLQAIRCFVPAAELAGIEGFRGIRWPGHTVGRARPSGGFSNSLEAAVKMPQDLFLFATRASPLQLLVIADDAAYALTPQDVEDFVVCLRAVRDTGSTAEDSTRQTLPELLTWSIWRDRTAHAINGLSMLLNGALFGYLTLIYGRLPAETALYLDGTGQVSRTGNPAALFMLPLIGLLVWSLNGLLGWLLYHFLLARPVALIVWGATAAIQVTIWIAALALVYAP